MTKFFLSFSALFLISSVIQCTGVQKPDPAVVACKNKCETTYGGCVKRASKNEAKKTACEAARIKCSGDCEKK